MNSFYIETYGCQMNEYDSERIAHILERCGLLPVSDIYSSELVVINTCSVREKPEQKVKTLLGRLRQNFKKRGLPLKIGVMGCFAQAMGEGLLKNYSVDFVLGTDSLEELPLALEKVGKGERVCLSALKKDSAFAPFKRKVSVAAYLTIMKGCDNFCSYCIVPYVRGREVSREPGEILFEARELIKGGTREITLLGQNVNSYGKDKGVDFPVLLSEAARLKGLSRLRFVTSHPKDFSPELVRVMAEHKNICPIVHLPLQSGSDRVLRRMNRGYTLKKYLEIVREAKETLPAIRFSSDFIVGFPGEKAEDFEETLRAMREADFESSFVFCYSPRPKTKAEKLEDDVPRGEKAERLEALVALQDKLTAERYASLVGGVAETLVEGVSKRDSGMYSGRTVYNRVVNFTSDKPLNAGELVEVKIEKALRNTLVGKVVKIDDKIEIEFPLP